MFYLIGGLVNKQTNYCFGLNNNVRKPAIDLYL